MRIKAILLVAVCTGWLGGAHPAAGQDIKSDAKTEQLKKKSDQVFGLKAKEPGAKAGPKLSALEEMLAKALQQNPDIKVAEAKVREADAELNRTRLKVMERVAFLYAQIEGAKLLVNEFEAKLAKMQGRAISDQEYSDARVLLQKQKSELAKLEAELPFALGKQPSGDATAKPWDLDGVRFMVRSRAVEPSGGKQEVNSTTAEKTLKALKKTVKDTSTLKNITNLGEAVEVLQESMKDVNLVLLHPELLSQRKGNVNFGAPVTVAAALQWVEDAFDIVFVVREYGIVGVQRSAIPGSGALLLRQFVQNGEKAPMSSAK